MTITDKMRSLFLREHPDETYEGKFLKIHEGCGGWNSGVWAFEHLDEKDEESPMYLECWQTGFTNTGYASVPPTRDAAIAEALGWAEMEDLPVYIPGVTDQEEGVKLYRKTESQPMAPWTPETDMTAVSVSEADAGNGSPKDGDMIAWNPVDPSDRWLVAQDYFLANYEEVLDGETSE